MEPVEPVYSNIKIIILAVIPVVVSSSNSMETPAPAHGGVIIRPIIYSNLSTNKKAEFQGKYSRFRTLKKDYNKKIDIFSDIIKNIQTSIVKN
jgi:hypothetical protein